MKKTSIILFLICNCYSFVCGQIFNDCISIDFESVLSTQSVDGLTIRNQFQDTFGLSFYLETGGFPVLAEVGGNQTAFNSVFGPDTPAPDQGIGSFFLTDDGTLAGLNAPPIILNFESPVDSFSGCILDMDFGELFIIHARDEKDQIILADTVLSSDPGTGDGMSTCWGFNLEGCEGTVYSIRFEGQRTQAGGFGMGIDNLVFCLSGIDIANAIDIETTMVGCDGTPGSITILNTSNGNYIYSIDGVNFQESPIFEDLEIGTYTITIQDEVGCNAEIDVMVEEEVYSTFTQIDAIDTSCDLENGSISITIEDPKGYTFSIDGVDFQTWPIFDFLDDGIYIVYVRDPSGCEYQEVVIIENRNLLITNENETHTTCNEQNGSIEISSSFNDGVSYTINGTDFQDSPIFTDLPPGVYTILITDSSGCSDTQSVTILPSEEVQLLATADPDWCNDGNGSISLQASGGSGNYSFFIEGAGDADVSLSGASASFIGLEGNTYTANVMDDTGCSDQQGVTVDFGESIIINDLDAIDPTCENLYGSINLDVEGGNGIVQYSFNGGSPTTASSFTNLDAGEFSFILTDAQGCQDSIQARLDYPICPIYIPNAFSPQNDGYNDFFEVFTNNIYDVEVLHFSVFDRWGNLLWENNDFSIHKADNSHWWDGNFRGKFCNQGVYVYMIKVRYLNGKEEAYSGDFTLLR